MERIAVIGAGEFGMQVLGYIKQQNKYFTVGFFDDYISTSNLCGVPLIGKISDVQSAFNNDEFDYLFIAIGYRHLKLKCELMELFSSIPFGTIVHPSAIIERGVVIEEGVLVCGNACLGMNSRIAKGAVIHVSSFVSHDNIIGGCSYISPGVNFGGNSKTGERCFIGIGATILDGISIHNDVIVGAASLVLKDITESGKYIGVPVCKIENR